MHKGILCSMASFKAHWGDAQPEIREVLSAPPSFHRLKA